MGQVKVLGKGLGATVYEDTNPHKHISQRSVPGEVAREVNETQIIPTDAYPPEYWTELPYGLTDAERAMQRAQALSRFDQDFTKPILAKGERRRFSIPLQRKLRKRRRQQLYTRRQFRNLDKGNRFADGTPGSEIVGQHDHRKWSVYAVIAWVGSVLTTSAGFSAIMIGVLTAGLNCK